MSTTVDQRVVEMRFDNKQFEQNCSQTMSTLEKLKQRLNLTGASKGLQEVDRAAKNVNMSGLGTSVEAVSAKFSAMQVVGVTALANITNQAVNTGKRMISALTIDPIKTGFQEYETQINAVQTILANTSSKGTNIDQVNEALEELNKYADKTIYNFTEMTRNIGTFTAAGVDLDTSVSAIQGIANLAAVSGSTSQQASTAMYQLSQALAAGTVKLQDWNSVVNAGMGGEVFQNALKRTAKVMGTDVDAMIEKYGSFRESLSKGEWLTTDVLTETLNQFTMAAEEGSKEWEEFKKTLKEKGYTEEQATEILKMANTATDAATKVKTFTQLWDVMKESAQSGWSQTWKLIIGDFEEAKGLLTPLADFFTNAINKMSDARNSLIEGALGKSFRGLVDKVRNVVDPIKKSADSIKDVVKSVEEYVSVVDDIIGGNWGTGQERWDKLAAAGYDWAHAQNLVNEKLGNSKRHATDYKEATDDATKATEKAAEATGKLSKEEMARIDMHARMSTKVSDEYMATLGYTKEQTEALRELAATADKLGMPVKELLENIDEIDGRWLLMNSFKNIGMSIVNIFKAIGKAYREIFPPMQADTLFNIIAGFYKFTRSLEVNSDTAEKITRTFKGLFAIIDIITTLVGGGLKIAFKLVSSILSYFHLDILDVTAAIGDALVGFRDWVDSLFDVSGALDFIVPLLTNAAKAIKKWFNEFSSSPRVQKYIQGIVDAFSNLANTDFKSIGTNIVEGFQIGIKEGISRAIDGILEVGKKIIKAFCSLLGIHSPSTVFMTLGGFIVAGLVLGIKEGIVAVPETLKTIVDKCVAIFQAVDWGTIFAIGVTAASLLFIKKVTDALEALASPLEGLGDIFEATAKTIKNFGKIGTATANNINAKALRNLVISLGILAAIAVGLMYFFSKADITPGAIIGASVMILTLAAVLVGMAWAIGQISDASVDIDAKSKKLSVKGLRNSLIPLAASILIVATAVKLISTMSLEEGIGAFTGLALVVGAMLLFLKVLVELNNGIKDTDIDKIGSLMTRLSIAMLLMVAVCKLAGNLSTDEMKRGAAFATGFAVFVLAMVGIHRLVGKKELSKLGGMMLKLAVAMMLMVGVCKLVNVLNIGDALKGAAFAAAFVLFVKGLTKALTVGQDKQIAKLGGLLLSISVSMLLMVGVCKLAGKLSVEDMLKGAAFMGAFVLFIKALVWATKIGNDQQLAKVGLMVFSLAAAVGILALVSVAMSLISIGGLAKGITAVGLLSIFMANMIKATKGAQNIKSSLLIMAIAIGVMALAVAGLSFIPIEKLAAATAAMGVLMGMFAVMIKSAKTIEKSVGTAIVLASVLVVMAGVLWLLSTLDVKASLTNAGALSLLMLAVAGTMRIVGDMKMSIKDALKAVVGLTAMVIPMAAFAYVLSKMSNIENAIGKIATISGLMLAMTGLLALINMMNMGPANFGKTLLGVLALTAMVAPMATFIAMLAWIQNIDGAAANAVAITKLMYSMTGLMAILAIVGGIVIATGGVAAGAIGIGILALVAMVAPMATFIGMLAWMQNIQNAEVNANLLISLMTVMTGLLTQLAIIGPFALIGVSALAALTGLMAAVGGLVVAIGAIDEMTDGGLKKLIDTGLPLLIQLAEGIGLMIGKFAGGMIEGVAESIVTLMESLKEASIHASGIEAGSFDGVKDLLTVLGDLGKTMVGTQFADIFVLGGDSIDKFREDGKKFFGALSEISKEMVAFALPEGFSSDNVLSLLDMLKTISSYSIGSSWKDWFFLGSADSIEIFKEDGKAFFGALSEISKEMTTFALPEGFSTDSFTSIMDALKAVGSYTMGESWKQAFSWFGTQDSMENFKTDGVNFFKAIKAISAEMVGFSFPAEFSVDGLTTLLDSLKSVGSMTVGLTFADIFSSGGTSMEKFQTDGIAFFQAAKAISGEMVGFSFPAKFSVEGLTTLLDVLKSVGNYSMGDSWKTAFSWFPTQDAVANFKTDGVNFFKAIRDIGTEASGLTTDPFEMAQTVIDKLKALLASVKGVDYSGVEKFTGIGTGGFGADGPIHDIAVALKDFANQLSGINVESMSTAITAAGKIRSIISNLAGLDTSGVSTFKNAINELSDISLDGFIAAFNVAIPTLTNVGGNMIDALIKGIRSGQGSLPAAANSVINTLISSVRSRQSTLASAGSAMVDGLVKGLKSKHGSIIELANEILRDMINVFRSKLALFDTTGTALIAKFVGGIMQGAAKIPSAITTPLVSTITATRGYYWSFYSAGSYLVDGFASGISANSYKAAAQAAAMASAAVRAAQEALGINSPSKVFYGIGEFSGMGLINALKDYGSKVYNAGADMAGNARNGLSDAIGKVADLINGDVDVNPTITPVLDLSNVQAGVGALNGMFGSSVGLSANIGAISAGMNARQNGVDSEVVSAINALRRDLGNVGNTTYTINGITYDDGSNISDAVKSLVRAAKVERRI